MNPCEKHGPPQVHVGTLKSAQRRHDRRSILGFPVPADGTCNRDEPFPLSRSQFLAAGLMRNDKIVPVLSY